MAKTRQELIYKALRNLGVLPQGQAPGSEEYNQLDGLVDPMVEDLIARDICFIEDVDAIDEKYFLSLAHVLAGHALSDFGMQNDAALTARAVKGERDLHNIFSTRPTYQVLEVQPF